MEGRIGHPPLALVPAVGVHEGLQGLAAAFDQYRLQPSLTPEHFEQPANTRIGVPGKVPWVLGMFR